MHWRRAQDKWNENFWKSSTRQKIDEISNSDIKILCAMKQRVCVCLCFVCSGICEDAIPVINLIKRIRLCISFHCHHNHCCLGVESGHVVVCWPAVESAGGVNCFVGNAATGIADVQIQTCFDRFRGWLGSMRRPVSVRCARVAPAIKSEPT